MFSLTLWDPAYSKSAQESPLTSKKDNVTFAGGFLPTKKRQERGSRNRQTAQAKFEFTPVNGLFWGFTPSRRVGETKGKKAQGKNEAKTTIFHAPFAFGLA
ncbi:hypothetical protein EFU54_17560 [Vibrio cholerae]|nr:hypothetical protein [Vibrio cholerae]